MIPKNNDELKLDFTFNELPTRTYKLNTEKETIVGFTDKEQAMIQAIYLILSIERYEYVIYSWNYGVELISLFGKPISYVIPELKRRITEALLQDERINAVENFEFTHKGNKVFTKFTVYTVFGELSVEKEVTI